MGVWEACCQQLLMKGRTTQKILLIHVMELAAQDVFTAVRHLIKMLFPDQMIARSWRNLILILTNRLSHKG